MMSTAYEPKQQPYRHAVLTIGTRISTKMSTIHQGKKNPYLKHDIKNLNMKSRSPKEDGSNVKDKL